MKDEQTILVTGFEKYGDDEMNFSREVVESLPDNIGGIHLEKLITEVLFDKAAEQIIEHAVKVKPVAIVSVGQARKRDKVNIETVARNWRNSIGGDVSGFCPKNEKILDGGPEEYLASVPVERIINALYQAGIPVTESQNAGAYVCNEVFYRCAHHFADKTMGVVFVHLPVTLSVEEGRRAIEIIVREIAGN